MKLNQDTVPATVDEAIKILAEGLSPEDIDYIKKNSSNSVHFGFGMVLRNNWSFWEQDTPIQKDFKKRFNLFGHGDDMSSLILEGVWTTVMGKDVRKTLNEAAERFRKHWDTMGVDPVTGEERNSGGNKTIIYEIS